MEEPETDLYALEGLQLEYVCLEGSQVENLEPLRGMPLGDAVSLSNASAIDLSPLMESPIKRLYINNCPLTNLNACADMPL
ncbi:hypothetical protein P4C99_22300, partial [Pontiellaceae bacterium B1224]|nr:hypothetical protein [Pontiellaceae bacterium B1224]